MESQKSEIFEQFNVLRQSWRDVDRYTVVIKVSRFGLMLVYLSVVYIVCSWSLLPYRASCGKSLVLW